MVLEFISSIKKSITHYNVFVASEWSQAADEDNQMQPKVPEEICESVAYINIFLILIVEAHVVIMSFECF